MVDALADQTTSSGALPWGTFGPVLAVHFLGTLGFSLAIPFLVYIVTDLGGAAWTYGLVGATYSTCQLLGAPILGRWSDRTGRRPVLVASQVGTLVAWLIFLVALSLPILGGIELAGATLTLPLLLVFVARAVDGATGGNISVANALVADLTADTPALRQEAFGRMGQAASMGFVIGPAAAGLLGGGPWGPRLPIAIAAGVALVTTGAIAAFLREPKRRCPEGPPGPTAVESTLHQQDVPCNHAPVPRRGAVWGRPQVRIALLGTFIIFLGFNVFFASFPVHAESVFGWTVGELGGFFAVLAGVMWMAQGPGLRAASRRLPPPQVFAIGLLLLAVRHALLRVAAGAGDVAGSGVLRSRQRDGVAHVPGPGRRGGRRRPGRGPGRGVERRQPGEHRRAGVGGPALSGAGERAVRGRSRAVLHHGGPDAPVVRGRRRTGWHGATDPIDWAALVRPMIPEIEPRQAAAWLRDGAAVVLDVREPFELKLAAVAGALHIPMGQLPGHLEALRDRGPIAVLCHHGVRSWQVAMWLTQQGLVEVVNIRGGIDAWADQVNPAVGRY